MSAEQEPADLQRIAEVLNRHGVDYILVGGMAGRLHGATRATWDVDVVTRPGEDNLDRLGAALRELRARIRGAPELSEAVIAQQTHPEALGQRQFGNWTTEAGELDTALFIGTHNQPITYDQLHEHAMQATYDGVPLVVAALGDIVAAKEIADRDKDHDALPELRRLLEERAGDS